ncbi:SRPBCC family protein [Membranihabitans marinus]|uniref:SRPBCC family protein n=1 Tax=Membranihabitans marinus TaxID=1227546 RepID=UPI001F2C3C41|nr:SRPBCC family protein [Membranihabitans marinus]
MTFIYVLIVLVVIIFVLGAIAPNELKSSRSINIDRPLHDVYEYLSFLKNQDEWAKWNRLDPDMEKKYTGEDGQVGFESYWNSNHKQVGEGIQIIKALEPNHRIDTKLIFLKPFKSEADAYLTCNSINSDETEVTWGFTSPMKRPMNIMMLFVNMEKQIGADFEEGLQRLKTILES